MDYNFKQVAGYTQPSKKDWEKLLVDWRRGTSAGNPLHCLLLVKRGDDAEAKHLEAIGKQQPLVDDAVYYRNLAIMLGAKPEQMTNAYDRDLCAKGIDDKPDGYSVTMADQQESYREAWAEVDRLKAQIAAQAELHQKQLDDMLIEAAGGDPTAPR